MKIEIEWLSDDSDCEVCGMSWAEGARVVIDGEEALLLKPTAGCFGGTTYSEKEVFSAILSHLGHTVEDNL